jgi:hypothetical protein
MKIGLKSIVATLGLLVSFSSEATLFDLGTVTPQSTQNVFSFNVSGAFGENYRFSVDTPFAFTSSVDGYNVINSFNTSLSETGGNYLFGQDSLSTIVGPTNAYRSNILEKFLDAGNYTFSVGGTSSNANGMYTGSFTVGRPASVGAVPEAETYMLMLVGFMIFGAMATRRKSLNV